MENQPRPLTARELIEQMIVQHDKDIQKLLNRLMGIEEEPHGKA